MAAAKPMTAREMPPTIQYSALVSLLIRAAAEAVKVPA